MKNSEEILHGPIRKSRKDRCQCTRSNKINGNFVQMTKNKTLCRSYRPLQHLVKRGLVYHTVKSISTKPTSSEGLYRAP